MMMKAEWKLTIDLCKYALNIAPLPIIPEGTSWSAIGKLCEFHKIAPLVNEAIKVMDGVPSEIKEKFSKAETLELARDTVQMISFEEFVSKCEQEGIDIMPLKGFYMKALYPKSHLRMMGDIDVLFKPQHQQAISTLLQGLGYHYDHQADHHDCFFRNPFMNIEMHNKMTDQKGTFEEYFNNYWDKAVLVDGKKHMYKQTNEDFYIFMIVHMSKHFTMGGCGLRSMMDLWLYLQRYEKILDHNYIHDALEHLGLVQFNEKMIQLTKVWFEDQPMTPFYESLTAYLMTSGIYGTTEHNTGQRVAKADKDAKVGQVKIWIGVIFLPYKHMCLMYPYLEKYPFLLPWAWVQRMFRTIFKKKGQATKVLKQSTVNTKKVETVKDLLNELGL